MSSIGPIENVRKRSGYLQKYDSSKIKNRLHRLIRYLPSYTHPHTKPTIDLQPKYFLPHKDTHTYNTQLDLREESSYKSSAQVPQLGKVSETGNFEPSEQVLESGTHDYPHKQSRRDIARGSAYQADGGTHLGPREDFLEATRTQGGRLEDVMDDFIPIVHIEPILKRFEASLIEGLGTHELDVLLMEVCQSIQSIHPDYSRLAGSLAVTRIWKSNAHTFSEAIERNEFLYGEKKGTFDSKCMSGSETLMSGLNLDVYPTRGDDKKKVYKDALEASNDVYGMIGSGNDDVLSPNIVVSDDMGTIDSLDVSKLKNLPEIGYLQSPSNIGKRSNKPPSQLEMKNLSLDTSHECVGDNKCDLSDTQNIPVHTSPHRSKKMGSSMLYDPDFYEFVMSNRKVLDEAIDHFRDLQYDLISMRVLEKTYLLKLGSEILETPQYMLMRVACSIHRDDIQLALEAYNDLSQHYYIHATPTLYSAGLSKQQYSSCFLISLGDSEVSSVYEELKNSAIISSCGGGIGISFSGLMSSSGLRKHDGPTTLSIGGILPIMKVFNQMCRGVNQGGTKRKGGIAIYLEPWHPDCMEFLETRRLNSSGEIIATDLFTALWVPDIFMKRVKNDEIWTFMDPRECPDLHLLSGEQFEQRYIRYTQNHT